jgi:hypothetical protein
MLQTDRLNVSLIFHSTEARLSILGSTAIGHCMYSQWSLNIQPVVTVCTASGHWMYSQLSLYVQPVITLCTASGHWMCSHWSLYVQPVVTGCTAIGHWLYNHWSLYVQPVVTVGTASGHCMYSQINIQQFHVQPTQCICFVRIWEQTAIISLNSEAVTLSVSSRKQQAVIPCECPEVSAAVYTLNGRFCNSTFPVASCHLLICSSQYFKRDVCYVNLTEHARLH